jgi:class 3 adenylate cyclase
MENNAPGPARADPPEACAKACDRIRNDVERGAPWDACDVFREAVAAHGENTELLYWGALAHARAGATRRAHQLLDQAQVRASGEMPARLADILSLRGRLWKDALDRAIGDAGTAALAERARTDYLAAYALKRDPYPGTNAATLSWLLGDHKTAKEIAQEIIARLAGQTSPRSCWDYATEGEACLLLGQVDAARRSYAAAHNEACGNAGSIATMRRQLMLLARRMPEAAEVLPSLPAADVVAFAGHMIDLPDRGVPRFPSALVPAVRAVMRERLSSLHTPIVYTSAACGSDLIFIETALEAGAEVNIVLPFDREDFVRTSVAIGGDGWVERFDAALSRATRVIMSTEESHLGDDVLFEHAAMLLEGFSVLRAAQLCATPSLLCVIDEGSAAGLGGTHASLQRWQRHVGTAQTIDLRELRNRAALGREAGAATKPPVASVRPVSASAQPGTPAVASRPQRTLKTLLFADFSGFSRVHDAAAPLFQESFWKIAAGQIEASAVQPLMASTWGDALYAVFESTRDGAEFALRFLDRMLEVDWIALGLVEASPIRIALHAGPVFRGFDPIMGRDNYFGSSVTKAARIEPVTPPGMVYASEAFAATLSITARDQYALEYVGRVPLAKGYGESRIYRLDRR